MAIGYLLAVVAVPLLAQESPSALASRQFLQSELTRLGNDPSAELIRARLASGDFQAGDRIFIRVRGDSVLTDTFTVLSDLHLPLPALTLGLVMTASVARVSRSAMLSGLTQEYVRTARAKGVHERVVLVVHTLRPALLPIVSLTGIWAVALIGDSVTTELVFARPGLGKMMVGAMLQRDYTSLQSITVVYTFFVVGINLITDLAYGVVDPRIRSGAA